MDRYSHELSFVSSPPIPTLSPNPQCGGIRKRAFGVIRSRDWHLVGGISVLIRNQWARCSLSTWGYKLAVCSPEDGPRTQPCWHRDLGLSASWTMRDKCSLFICHPGYGVLSTAAQTKIGGFCRCSVPKLCPTLCNPKDCSTPGSPVLHCLLEFAHIYIHWVGDAI